MVKCMRNIHIVMLIGVSCLVQTLAEVCAYGPPRCECIVNTNVRCFNLNEVPPFKTGDDVTPVINLSFETGNITSIPKNSLPAGLVSIDMYSQPLTNLADDSFDASAASLQSVSFTAAKFTTLPRALTRLPKLRQLYIGATRIEYWDTTILQQIAASLESLRLSNVGLSAWPTWFSLFHLLTEVDLSWNTFHSVPDNAFSSITDELKYLYLANTSLIRMPQAVLTLPGLLLLDLSYNNFTGVVSEIEKITVAPFAKNMIALYLNLVGLTTMVNLSSMTSLTSLSLSRNKIPSIPAGSLPPSITYLDLGSNTLSSIPQDVTSMTKLTNLYLYDNQITQIQPNIFPSSLTTLNLGINKLTVITNTTFRNLNFLRDLEINNNPISTIETSAFTDLVSLQYLSMVYVPLTEIPLAFASLNTHVSINMNTIVPLLCPCPAPSRLVQWFTSLDNPTIESVECSNGQGIDTYLSGHCEH